MSEVFNPDGISRRHAFSFWWSAAALGLAANATALTVSNSEGQTSGMERRGTGVRGAGSAATSGDGRTDRREEQRNSLGAAAPNSETSVRACPSARRVFRRDWESHSSSGHRCSC